MDDSQSSDIFSETSVNRSDFATIDIEKYEVLVSKIKGFTTKSVVSKNGIHQEAFIVFLEDCQLCIVQSLDFINLLLEDANIDIDKLSNYLEDGVCVLQVLSNCIKTIVESVAITCKVVRNFSACTGNIILSVFTHCKDSECIYGSNLYTAEKQLKDLFRNCHELQLTYLLALEKHLIFDLTEKEDLDMLVNSLEINLKIGNVVQSLDVKTMAEQWKAYTTICEKYKAFLLDRNIFNKSSKLLVSTIETNIQTVLEANEGDKIVLRSLKVANFSLKILLRICNIFKCSINNDYKDVIKLLLHITLCNSSYYEVTGHKSSDFSALLKTHISTPAEMLVGALVNDENFLKLIFATKCDELTDSELLGYVLLAVMVIKAFLEMNNTASDKMDQVIDCVFSFLPYCHKWFNLGLKFKHTTMEDRNEHYGLYDHLLVHTAALVSRFNCQQYNRLESYLYEALLGTEFYSAIFASNLWVLICSMNNNQFQLEVLLGLLNIYQKLESHRFFSKSPQRIHLSYTIEKLFETLNSEKMQICKQFSVKDEKNIGIWTAMKIRNAHSDIANDVCDNLFSSFHEVINVNDENLNELIKQIKLVSTCSLPERDPRIADWVSGAWLKAFSLFTDVHIRHLKDRSECFLNYLEGLTSLTENNIEKIQDKTSVKVALTVAAYILGVGNKETAFIIYKLFCKLSISLLENNEIATSKITTITLSLLKNTDSSNFQQYIFNTILSDSNLSKLILPVLEDNKYISEKVDEYKNTISDTNEWHKQLNLVANNKYRYKCMKCTHINDVQDSISMEAIDAQVPKKSKSNFDLGDIDSLFGESDGEEPVTKKAKLDFNVDNVIGRIESDVENLCQSKENVLREYNSRIKCIYDKLRNIVT